MKKSHFYISEQYATKAFLDQTTIVRSVFPGEKLFFLPFQYEMKWLYRTTFMMTYQEITFPLTISNRKI
jgi:hypothetical protein